MIAQNIHFFFHTTTWLLKFYYGSLPSEITDQLWVCDRWDWTRESARLDFPYAYRAIQPRFHCRLWQLVLLRLLDHQHCQRNKFLKKLYEIYIKGNKRRRRLNQIFEHLKKIIWVKKNHALYSFKIYYCDNNRFQNF